MTTERAPWDRLRRDDGIYLEGLKAFQAFTRYREMGDERSLVKLAQETGKHKTLFEQWSRRFGWQDRLHAWEEDQERIRQQAWDRATGRMAERHARAAEALQGRAIQALAGLDTAEVGARDLAYMLDIGVKIERLSRGQPSERIELIGLLVTPLLQQLIAVFIECNDIEDADTRAAAFAERADSVVEGVVSRFLPAGGTA